MFLIVELSFLRQSSLGLDDLNGSLHDRIGDGVVVNPAKRFREQRDQQVQRDDGRHGEVHDCQDTGHDWICFGESFEIEIVANGHTKYRVQQTLGVFEAWHGICRYSSEDDPKRSRKGHEEKKKEKRPVDEITYCPAKDDH